MNMHVHHGLLTTPHKFKIKTTYGILSKEGQMNEYFIAFRFFLIKISFSFPISYYKVMKNIFFVEVFEFK